MAWHQCRVMPRGTGSGAQHTKVPQLHWVCLLYTYITVYILTYLFFLAMCVEGILQADGSKNQEQYKYRVKAFINTE